MEGPKDVRIISLPVFNSVTFTLYSVMTPFLVDGSGGVHESLIEVELIALTFKFSGELEGAREINV